MQPKSRFIVLAFAALSATMLLAGCGGGDTGKTWFNLPSVEVAVNEAGQAKVAGFTLPGAVLQPAQIEQLQAAGVDQIEARIGYNGIHALLNGEDLPYLAWDQESTAVVQDIVRTTPGIPSAGLIADLLPSLRTYGMGAAIQLPGAADANIARWSGETAVTAGEAPAEPTIGPIDISSITFTPEGEGFIGPVPLAAIGAPVTLPANITSLISQLGIESLSVDTEPTGLNLAVNDGAFPDLAYDADRLERAMVLANTFLGDSPLMETLNSVADQLPGADVRATVTFNGEPAGGLVLDNLRAVVNDDGTVEALGLPLPVGSLLPPELIGQLSAAGLQNVNVNISGGAVAVANNGNPFPRISWSDAGENLVTSLAPALGMPSEQVRGILDVVGATDIALDVALPGAPEAGSPTAPTEFAPVELNGVNPPIIRTSLAVDESGAITRVGNIATSDLAMLGISGLALPANIMQILEQTGASALQVQTTPGHADVLLDGEVAVSLDYDVASLQQVLTTVKPFINVALLENPGVSRLLDEVMLPVVAGSQIDLTVELP